MTIDETNNVSNRYSGVVKCIKNIDVHDPFLTYTQKSADCTHTF